MPPSRSRRSSAAEVSVPSVVESAGDVVKESDDSAALSYEARRQAQIQRNQALLSELTGISASTSLSAADAAARVASASAASAERRVRAAERRREREALVALLPRRDLPGRRAKGSVNYAEDRLAAHAEAAASTVAAAASSGAEGGAEETDQPPRANASLADFIAPDHASLRAAPPKSAQTVTSLPLRTLARYIGNVIPLTFHSPKAAAMSFLLTGWPSEDNVAARKPPPSFNRLSGIQKVANHIALFINIDPERGYGNQWLEGGRRITWFAQPTQRVDTPVVGQIITAARALQAKLDGSAAREGEAYARDVLGVASGGATASLVKNEPDDDSSPPPAKRAKRSSSSSPTVKKEPSTVDDASSTTAAATTADADDADASFDAFSVLLFLRFEGGPYVYAGPLAYHAHDTTRTPMKFIFTLTEYDTLIKKEGFRDLLPGASVTVDDDSKTTSAKKEA